MIFYLGLFHKTLHGNVSKNAFSESRSQKTFKNWQRFKCASMKLSSRQQCRQRYFSNKFLSLLSNRRGYILILRKPTKFLWAYLACTENNSDNSKSKEAFETPTTSKQNTVWEISFSCIHGISPRNKDGTFGSASVPVGKAKRHR